MNGIDNNYIAIDTPWWITDGFRVPLEAAHADPLFDEISQQLGRLAIAMFEDAPAIANALSQLSKRIEDAAA